jgi:DNA primase
MERDDAVERVREAIDIVELIGSYVDLRPAGRSFKARCPFHREKTPSFVVSPEKQVFHCFGCGVGGDVFSFVMKHDGLAFPEALALLARRAGIELPERGRREEGPDKSQLIEALRAAVRYYRGQLRGAAGAAARDYLQGRSFSGRILDLYYVGYAPGGGQALVEQLGKQYPREVLIQAGLLGQAEGGRLYDRFRDRVTLPILGVGGEPIGFGARALRAGVEPKYLNSPETRVYRKRGELFGLPQARQAIRQEGQVLIVEGYFDVLSLAAAGLHQAVAPCGTSWTPQHTASLLRLRQGQRILFLFDGDAAGRSAAWRALSATLPRHAEVGMVLLPPGKDPDDLVRAGELEALRAAIAAPLSPVAFGLEVLRAEGLESHALVERIAEMLAHVGSPIARELMIDEAAERSRLPVQLLRREVERLSGRIRPRTGVGEETPAEAAPAARLTPMEAALLRLVQAQPAAAGALLEAARGAPAIGAGVRNVLAWAEDRARSQTPPDPPELLRRLRGELGAEVDAGFLLAEDLPAPDERLLADLLRRLREAALDAEKERIGYEIRTLEARAGSRDGEAGEADRRRLAELLSRKQSLARELAHLRAPEGHAGG